MISADLKGKAVLVTGGVSGIGLAAAELFASNGASVAVNHLSDDPAAGEVIERLTGNGLEVIAAPGDVSDPAQGEAMVQQAAEQLGRLDVLINNRLIARDTSLPLSEFIDGRAGAASKYGKRSEQDAANGSAMPLIDEFDQAPAPDE